MRAPRRGQPDRRLTVLSLDGSAEAGDSLPEEDVLTARELEVLLLSARGLSNQQIARMLHLADSTVKRHLANIYPKIGVSSRGGAARKALLKNWITIEEITEE